MIVVGPRRSSATSARETVAWLFLVVAAIAATFAAVYAGLGYYRGQDILDRETAILDAIAALQDCCDAVQATLATVLLKIAELKTLLQQLIGTTNAIQTTVVDIDHKLDSIQKTCTPLYEPYQILDPGCYYFANDIYCNDTSYEICFLLSGNVHISLNGQSYQVHPSGIAFAAYYGYDVTIENGYIFTEAPSNVSTSRAVDAFLCNNIVLRNLYIENFFRPIADLYSQQLRLEGVLVDGAYAVNQVGYGNRALSAVATSSVLIERSLFFDNNVRDAAYYGNTYGVTFLSIDDYPTVGIQVHDSVFYDTLVSVGSANSLVSSGSGLIFDRNVHVVTDSQFTLSWMGWGLFCDIPSVACAVPAGGRIVNSAFVNRNAAAAFDGLYIAGADGLEIAYNSFVDNSNGFAPQLGTVNTAAVHICTQNTQVDQGVSPGSMCNAVDVHHNTFVGAVGTNLDQRAVVAILAEAGAFNCYIGHNRLSSYGAPLHGNGTYPDQYGAVVYLAAGSELIQVDENTVRDVSCPYGPTTFASAGLLSAGPETRTQYYGGVGPAVVFGASSGNSFKNNEVAGVCGCAMVDIGTNNAMYSNEVHANECSYVSPNAAIQCVGASPQVAGWNLDYDCLIL